MMRQVKASGGRIAVVAGPVVVHTGGVEHFSELIRLGYVDVLLAGNALAVHDIEYALSGTSLGIDLIAGAAVEQGHRNHMAAINTINRAGGIRPAVEAGVLTKGVMYECVTHGRRLRPRRQHQRRRAAAGHADGPRGSAGSLRHGTLGQRPARADAVVDAAQHRRRQHAALLGARGLRRHQPGRRDEAVATAARHRRSGWSPTSACSCTGWSNAAAVNHTLIGRSERSEPPERFERVERSERAERPSDILNSWASAFFYSC